jgi:hypothetical protein
MLMRPEPFRQEPRRMNLYIRHELLNSDFIAVVCFAGSGLLITILLAWIFPLGRAIDLVMLFD